MKGTRAFLDASCWIAAAGSPTGGSAAIIKIARAGYVRIVASREVLEEAERNIAAKMGRDALLRFYRELGGVDIELVPSIQPEECVRWRHLVAEKDCHVLAAAYKARANFLISLDRRHILTAKVRAGFPIPVKDTGEFLQALLEEVGRE